MGNENAAQFDWMGGIATDNAGNVFVTQPGQGTIRKITPTGVVTTLAGTVGAPGNVDASGATARFRFPMGVATDGSGNVYVADESNHSIRKINQTGTVTTLVASTGIVVNGVFPLFSLPRNIVADDSGNVYLSNAGNILKITPAGATSSLVTARDSTATTAWLGSIDGIAMDKSGNIFLSDSRDHTIHRVSPTGTMSLLAGSSGVEGNTDGLGSAARFKGPRGVAADSNGNVYVADSFNGTVRKISPTGLVSTLTANSIGYVTSVAVESNGNVFAANSAGFYINKITPAGVATILTGTAGVKGTKDGTAASIQFYRLKGVTAGSNGNLYVADGGDHTVRQITPAGLVSTLAGSSGRIGSNDGIGASALFNSPTGTATDQDGNVYVADSANHTIRKISPSGVVTTLAGKAGLYGSSDGTGESARFREPGGLATDSVGNVYVADIPEFGDADGFAIRKITPEGAVSTLMKPANLIYLKDIAVDKADNLYFIAQDRADRSFSFSTEYSELTVYKLTPAGELSTMGKTSTGTKALFSYLTGITVDRSGNVYVAQSGSIQKITPAGAVSTLMTKLGMDYSDFDGMFMTTSGTTLYFTTTHGVNALMNALP